MSNEYPTKETWGYRARMLKALLSRDLLVIHQRIKDDIFNSLMLAGVWAFVFRFFAPLIGFDERFVFIIFLGTVNNVLISLGFSRSMGDLHDMYRTGFMDYQRTLPLTTSTIMLSRVLIYAIHMIYVTVPVLIFGKIFLGSTFNISAMRIPYVLIIYLSTILFVVCYYLNMVFSVSLTWFSLNIWQRMNTPLIFLGCQMYAFKPLFAIAPSLSALLLFNPYTYCNEGFRSAIAGDAHFLPAWVCALVLMSVATAGLYILFGPVKRRLDWV